MAVTLELLNRPVYSEADAADILRVPRSTLHWWLEGRSDNGRAYPPVIRPEPTGAGSLTWGEFVEAALLSSVPTRTAGAARRDPALRPKAAR